MADPAPRAPADAPQRYVATTRGGRGVAIDVRPSPRRLSLWIAAVHRPDAAPYETTGVDTPDEALADGIRVACERVLAGAPIREVLAAGEPTRAALLAANAALRTALLAARNDLERHGRHDADCDCHLTDPVHPCACGLADAIADATQSLAAKPGAP